MRQTLAIAGLAALLLTVAALDPAGAHAGTQPITDFQVEITVADDASIVVTETITMDFSRQRGRGIYRQIPVTYRHQGFMYELRFSLIDVTDESGRPYETLIKSKTIARQEYVYIRVGSEDIFYNRPKTFVLTYRVQRALLFYPDRIALLWNVTGDDWDMVIERAEARVYLPETQVLDSRCYTGRYGSTASDCTIDKRPGGGVDFRTGRLNPGEQLTIELDLPPDAVVKPGLATRIGWFFSDNWPFGVPVLVLGLCLLFWWREGRDVTGKYTSVMPVYDLPDDLTPAEAGTVLDEKVDLRDISSIFIDLAVRGYIEIVEGEDKGWLSPPEVTFHKRRDAHDGLTAYEQAVMDGLFPVGGKTARMSDLKNKFYTQLPRIKNSLYKSVVAKRWFAVRPDRVRAVWLGIGVVVFALSFLLLKVPTLLQIPLVVSGALSGAIIMVFSKFMPRRTRRGSDMRIKVLGIEEYIRRAEKDRIERMPKELADRFLSFAIALDVVDEWADSFSGIYREPPNWYRGHYRDGFSTYWLAHSLDRNLNSLNRNMVSRPRSSGGGGVGGGFSGGGFSGGGFGGGGGGSW